VTSLQTAPNNTLRTVEHMPLQEALGAQHTSHKSLRNDICALWTCVGMVVRIKPIDLACTKLLELIRHQLSVIRELCVREPGSRIFSIRCEAVCFVLVAAGLPWVVWCWRSNNDSRAFTCEILRRVLDIGRVGQDAFLHIRVADLVALTRTIGPAVVARGSKRTTVVVPKLNDNEVFGLEKAGDLSEVAFDGVATGGATAYGFIDYRNRERVFEILTPACCLSDPVQVTDGGSGFASYLQCRNLHHQEPSLSRRQGRQ